MKLVRRICLICCLLAATAHRLPAPIVETEEKPTPAPEQSEAPQPKEKHSRAKSTTSSNEPLTKPEPRPARTREGPARFAGTWIGRINQGIFGNVEFTLVVNDAANAVRETSNGLHFTHPAILNGNTVSWQAGLLNEVAWTLTPNSDGRTALATSHSGLGVNGSATFRRGQNAPASTTDSGRNDTATDAGGKTKNGEQVCARTRKRNEQPLRDGCFHRQHESCDPLSQEL